MPKLKMDYSSPRWSWELLDCALPVSFDQYDHCSYDCLYCFAYNQKCLKVLNTSMPNQQKLFKLQPIRSVNPKRVMQLFDKNHKTQFRQYIDRRITFQWGGLSDPFDMYEKRHGIGLELLQFFHKIQYPICFSTKATWWTEDDRYMNLFKSAGKFWNVKFSIINNDYNISRLIEKGCPSPEERLEAGARLTKMGVSCTLRLRPFIIGMSDVDGQHLKLIEKAADFGFSAVSTEFFCMEQRGATFLRQRYDKMSEALGFDLVDFYRKNSLGAGYLRLNYNIKTKYIDEMEKACKKRGMRYYVSDAHHKDRCSGGCCCGLGEEWNYQRGQWTEMLCLAKSRKDGRVYWKDMEDRLDGLFGNFLYRHATQFNTGSAAGRAKFHTLTMKDWIRYQWNNVNSTRGIYKYFYGLLRPKGKDKDGNYIYKYYPYE